MSKSKLIAPKGLLIDVKKMRRTVDNALTGAAKGAKADFGVTTRTWDDRPTFDISTPEPFVREVSTDDPIYSMLNEGTKAHDIRPKRSRFLVFQTPFRSKTVPNDIRSRKGSKGKTTVRAKVVRHPGTAARNWTKAIKQKWDKQLPVLLQRAIDSTVTG